jgi:hypothetical protein
MQLVCGTAVRLLRAWPSKRKSLAHFSPRAGNRLALPFIFGLPLLLAELFAEAPPIAPCTGGN